MSFHANCGDCCLANVLILWMETLVHPHVLWSLVATYISLTYRVYFRVCAVGLWWVRVLSRGGRFTHTAKCLATPTFVDHTPYYVLVHHSYIFHIWWWPQFWRGRWAFWGGRFTPAPPPLPPTRWNPVGVVIIYPQPLAMHIIFKP